MQKVKTHRKFNVFFLIAGIFLVLFTAFMFLLFLMAINTSLKSRAQMTSTNDGSIFGLPKIEYWRTPNYRKDEAGYGTYFGNYVYAFKNLAVEINDGYYAGLFTQTRVDIALRVTLGNSIFNTLLYVIPSSAIAAFTPMFMGYLCAKYKNKGSAFLYALVLFVMATPIVGNTPSMVNLMRSLRLYNTFIGNWLRVVSFTNMYFLIYYAFFTSLSSSFDEAAEIDGASQISVMFRICMPLASSIFWTIFLMMFVSFWNDYTTPMLYMPGKPTLSYLIYYRTTYLPTLDSYDSVLGEYVQTSFDFIGRKMAVLMVFAIPIIVIFAIFNKQLMTNLTMGGVKE